MVTSITYDSGSESLKSKRVGAPLSARDLACLYPALLVAPAALLLILWFVVPLARLSSLAFAGEEGALASFSTLFGSAAYRQVFLNTFQISFVVTVVTVVLAFPVALLLSRLRGIWFVLALYGVLFPFWVSLLVRTYSWILLLPKNGPINQALMATGLIEAPVQLLFNNTAVVIGMTHVLLPYAILPLFARMRGIDGRLLQASDGLGASLFDTFRYVYLPLLMPGLLGAGLVVFLLALGFFVTPALLGGAGALTVSTLIAGFVTDRLAWSLAAAGAIILLAAVLLLLVLFRRLLPLGRSGWAA